MTAVEFRAFGAYVRKIIADDGGGDSRPGLRCELWCPESPGQAQYSKQRTFLLDLDAHPGGQSPSFAARDSSRIECDAPGFTAIGAGARHVRPFEASDDYVNRVYLSESFCREHGGLELPPVENSGRIERPHPYERRSYVYPSDDEDVDRRGRRYLGYHAEVVERLEGTRWKVHVYRWNSERHVQVSFDFADLCGYGAQSTIEPRHGATGSLFLEHNIASTARLPLPKLPPSQGTAAIPRGSLESFVDEPPVPSAETLEALARWRRPPSW